jgi:hypothetical protein
MQILQPSMQKIAEVEQHWRSQTALAQAFHDLKQINFVARRARGAHKNIAVLTDLEEPLAPTAKVVDIGCVIDRPRINARFHAGDRRSGVRAGLNTLRCRRDRRENLRH